MFESFFAHTKKLLQHDLIKGSAYIFSSGLIASVLNFLFNLLLTHKLSYQDYGIYAAIISFAALLSIPSQAVSPIVVRFATEYIAKNQIGKAKHFYKQLMIFLLLLTVSLLFLIYLLSPILRNFFQIHNTLFFLLAVVFVGLGYITVVNFAFIQSQLRFQFLSFLTALQSVAKIAVGGLCVLLGLKVAGVLGALIFASLIPIGVSFFSLQSLFKQAKEAVVSMHVRQMYTYSVMAFVTMLALTSFTSSDILLVKHFFSSTNAGLYAGLSLVGKIIFYFSAPIATVLFPLLMNKFHRGEKMHGLLYVALLLVVVPSFAISAIFWIFPAFFIKIFLGRSGFLVMTPYLGLYGVYIALYSVCSLFATFFLTLHKKWSSYLVAFAAAGQIIGITLFHTNFEEVILVSVLVSFFLCLGFVGMFYYYLKKRST